MDVRTDGQAQSNMPLQHFLSWSHKKTTYPVVFDLGLIWGNAEEIREGSEELCSLINANSDFISLQNTVGDPERVEGDSSQPPVFKKSMEMK